LLQQVFPLGFEHVPPLPPTVPPTQAHFSSGAQQAFLCPASQTFDGSVQPETAQPKLGLALQVPGVGQHVVPQRVLPGVTQTGPGSLPVGVHGEVNWVASQHFPAHEK